VISVRGLRKRFGSVQAVADVNLEVGAGEVLLLLGQNGAGKSTTLRCLGGILRPDEGEIELDDLRLPRDLDALRTQLGVVPDLARLYGRNTAWEYLEHFGAIYAVPAAERRERIAGLLERFELSDAADRILSSYSRGMAQKVALIRATLHEPRWLFCDEPTVGLDPVAAADMRRYLGEQRDRGAAVIVTTHILVEAERCAIRTYTDICAFTHGKDPRTYAISAAILNEEIEHEAWFSEFLGEGPSGHFHRTGFGSTRNSPYLAKFLHQ